MVYRRIIGATSYVFADLRELLARATPPRSGDRLAGIAAESAEQMIAARMALADVPLKQFLNEAVIPYEDDEVTRLILDTHAAQAFAPISALTVGGFRDWLLSDAATSATLRDVSPGITPEMAAGVSKLMRNQDLILVAKKCAATTAFRNTIGLKGRMSVRLQPNHPFDDARGITA
jgi:ethanolamine ammonia-lyase large subunit